MRDFIIIQNENIKAKILLPENSRYQRSRFNHSGFISEVYFKGDKITHYERSLNTGFITTEGSGFCSQYEYNLISEDSDKFIRPGVGVMTKNQSGEGYEPFKYEVESFSDKVIIKALTPNVGGYEYEEIREISLIDDELIEKITLFNKGNKDIINEEYCHNFISLKGEDISPSDILNVPVIKDPVNAEDGDFYFDSVNSYFAFKDYPNSPYYLKFSEVNKIENAKDNIAWTLKSKENSSEISEIIDFTPSRVAIWGYYYTVCCEIFKGINIKPGFNDTWTRKWKFK